MSLLVYTAITQDYDQLRPAAKDLQDDARFLAFLERPRECAPWEVRPLERRHADPIRDAKIYKILPQQFLPDCDCSLWLDGKMELKSPIAAILECLQDADMVVFAHALRCCLYEEACQCIHRKLDDPDVIYRQVQRYTRDGFPANWGLADCAVLLRRHSAKMTEFSRLWWNQIESGSRRDQLSFTYCAWKCGIKIGYFPGFTHANPFFGMHLHKKPTPAVHPPMQDGRGHALRSAT